MNSLSTWSFAILNKRSSRRIRTYSISMPAAVLCAVILIGGLGGLCRLGYFTFSYVYGNFGVYQEQNQNRLLLNKLQFLGKYLQRESLHSKKIANAENTLRLKFGLAQIDQEVRAAGIGGRPTEKELMAVFSDPTIARADSVQESIRTLLRRMQLQSRTFSTVLDFAREKQVQWSERPAIWPVYGRITSGFGNRMHPVLGYPLFHEGLDIANEPWTPVFSTADGIVGFVGVEEYYGNMLVIDHRAMRLRTVYAHLIQPAGFVEGQSIKRGDLIGYMGSSGRTTGNHLHYEIRKGDKPVDPVDYIVPVDVIVD